MAERLVKVKAHTLGFYGCKRVPGTESDTFYVPERQKNATWYSVVPSGRKGGTGKGGNEDPDAGGDENPDAGDGKGK